MGQHREMLNQVLELFEIMPEYDLNVMKPGQNIFDVTTGIFNEIKIILKDFRPDIVLVYGDTITMFSTTLAAYYEQTPVGYVNPKD